MNSYYQSLNQMNLKKWTSAKSGFTKLKLSGGPKIAINAAFYLGVIDQTLGDYTSARKSFQYVLDNSKNPKLDTQAERFIEEGLRREAQANKKTQRLFFEGVLGAFYDSNIVLAIDGQANQQTDQEGLRFLSSNQLKYRFYTSEKNDLSLRAEATLMKSQKNNFDSSPALQAADPWVFAVAAPWSHRGRLLGKAYTFDVEFKYEVISMNLDDTVRKDIIHSSVLNFSHKLVISPFWILANTNEIRLDDANESTGTISNLADATKFSSQWSGILILDKENERYLIPKVGLSINDAIGEDFSYTRLELGLTFTSSLFKTPARA